MKNIHLPDRTTFTPETTVNDIWESLNLPSQAITSLTLPTDNPHNLPSSFKIDHLAQSTIALSALAASLVHASRLHQRQRNKEVHVLQTETDADEYSSDISIPKVSVSPRHAALAFLSERLYELDDTPPPSEWGVISGLYHTKEQGQGGYGYVRIHDSFVNHRLTVAKILAIPVTVYDKDGHIVDLDHVVNDGGGDGDYELRDIRIHGLSKEIVQREVSKWDAAELEERALQEGAVIVRLRSFSEWDDTPQGRAVGDFPIGLKRLQLRQSQNGTSNFISTPNPNIKHPLHGLRVLELSRVIAAPVAGRTLAAHGADVLWLTAPHLPALPGLDIDLSRGKRSIQLDFRREDERNKILELVKGADVFIQSYRPGCLERYGLGVEDLAAVNPGIVYASLSAYGGGGGGGDGGGGGEDSWAERRGFDSIVQTCSGMNVSEAWHFRHMARMEEDLLLPARPMPCQALDHGAGYLLATGILAAVYHRDFGSGGYGYGAYQVDVSLAGVMRYLRSLGQFEGASGFHCANPLPPSFPLPSAVNTDGRFWETKQCEFGKLKAVRHAGVIDGCETGWEIMPRTLGSDVPQWK